MKKILFIGYSLHFTGGVQKALVSVVNELCEYYDIEILTLDGREDFSYEIDPRIKTITINSYANAKINNTLNFIDKYFSKFSKKQNVKAYIYQYGVYLLLKKWLKTNHFKYDCIVTSWYMLSSMLSIMKEVNHKTIAWEHTNYKVGGLLWFSTMRRYYKNLKGIVYINDESKDYYKSLNSNTHLIRNIIGEPFESAQHTGIDKKENIILFVGRLHPEKNTLELIDIFSSLNNDSWKLILIGEGSERVKLESFIKEKNISNILLTGEKEITEVYRYMEKSKILVLTSEREGLPTVLVEAMFCSNVLVSYNCEFGPANIINDNNGYLVNLHDKETFKNKLQLLIDNQNLLDKLNKTSYQEAQKWRKEKYDSEMEKSSTINKKKKILIRIGSLRHGGAEKVLVTFLKNIPQDKYEIDLLLNLKSGKYLKEIPNWVNVFYLNKGEMITTNKPLEIPIKIYRKVYQLILKSFPFLLYRFILKNKNYDIELIANHALLEEVLNSPIKSSKKVVWVHSDIFNIQNYKNEKIRKFFLADKVLVISQQIKESFEKIALNNQEKEKIVRIYNPIDSQEIIEKSLERSNLQWIKETEEKTFFSVGTIYPAKGFDRLLKAHKRLLDEGLKNNVMIVGDGYDSNNINILIHNLNIEKTVKMVGFKSNPYPLFKKSDYFVLSSRYEGYPTVLFEALILKKPVIATDVSGVKEILQNGELGIIVENSEEGIYRGMKEFLTNPLLPKKYVEKMNKEELPFTLENAVNSLMKILDDL